MVPMERTTSTLNEDPCPPSCLSCASGPKSTHEVHHGHAPSAAAVWLIDLHADGAAAHDFVTSDGAFARTLALLEQAKASAQPVEVRTWLTRATYRHLRALPRLLKDAQVRAWHLHALPYGSAVPRLAMAWPHALRAAKGAEDSGLAVATYGAPRCVLGPFTRFAATEPVQSFGDKCSECAARTKCRGVDAGYLSRFGDEDLRALRA